MSLSRLFHEPFLRSPFHDFSSALGELERHFLAGPLATFGTPAFHNNLHSISPRLTMTELDKEYRIEAEVAGFPKQSLSLEFPDAKTLQISGKLEHNTQPLSASSPTSHTQSSAPDASASENDSPVKSTADAEQDGATLQTTAAPLTPSTRVWTEGRTMQQFSRRITLPGPVDIDAVQASLKHGILSIVMPRANLKPAGRHIEISETKP